MVHPPPAPGSLRGELPPRGVGGADQQSKAKGKLSTPGFPKDSGEENRETTIQTNKQTKLQYKNPFGKKKNVNHAWESLECK